MNEGAFRYKADKIATGHNADDMAEAFSSINPFYPKEEVRNMLYEHLRLTTNEVSARLKKDYNADIKAFDMVQKEILKMSKFFVDGIVKRHGLSRHSTVLFIDIFVR